MHLRSDDVRQNIPIGVNSLTKSATTGAEATTQEKEEFEQWILDRFRRKDEQMELFLTEGRLANGEFVDIPVRLRNSKELLGLLASCVLGLWLIKLTMRALWSLVR
jgi:hypothetical protein